MDRVKDGPDKDRRPSATDVARLAQVSQSAVSRTFTPGASVSDATRDRVLKAAAQLGYRPHLLPELLQDRRNGDVAVVAGPLDHPFHAVALDHIAAALSAAGRHVSLLRAEDDQALDKVVGALAGHQVDAVVTALAVRSPETAAALDRFGVPIIRFQSGAPGRQLWTVTSDNEGQGREAARLLLDAGCRSFAFVGGEGSANQELRGFGFVQALKDQGREVRQIAVQGHGYAAGVAAAERLFDGGAVDGLLCGNDLIACGVMDEARRRGVRVPDDLRVVGCDNIEQGGWAPYRLTTFDQRTDRLAARVMTMLEGEMPDERLIVLPMDFVPRDSV